MRNAAASLSLDWSLSDVAYRIVGFLTLSKPLPLWAIGLQGAGAWVAAWWLGRPPLIHTLAILMTFDWVCGAVLAYRDRRFDWHTGVWGIAKKVLVMWAVLIADARCRAHGVAPEWVAWGVLFYIFNEILSAGRKFQAADIPVAQVLLGFARQQLSKFSQAAPSASKEE